MSLDELASDGAKSDTWDDDVGEKLEEATELDSLGTNIEESINFDEDVGSTEGETEDDDDGIYSDDVGSINELDVILGVM